MSSGSATASVAPDPLTGAYDVWIHGPNGFLCHASGSVLSAEVGLEATLALIGYMDHPELRLTLRNHSAHPRTVHVAGLHHAVHTFALGRLDDRDVELDPLAHNHGWYDLAVSVEGDSLFSRQFAGHLEDGAPSRTGPD